MKSLLCISLLILLASIAAAEPGKAVEPTKEIAAIEALVERTLLDPLAKRESERSRFSRVRMPPAERRVRVTAAAKAHDVNGRAFFLFAIDARDGHLGNDEWDHDVFVGCAYTEGAVFVRLGDDYLPAKVLVGEKAKAPGSSVCVPRTDARAEAPTEPVPKGAPGRS